jgi:hypothetical protein
VEDTVRVYDIYPLEEKDWKKFLLANSYRAGSPTEFEKLQKKIYLNSTADVQTNDHITDPFEQKLPCRIITVSHLSPNVAKLLGAQYDISADFVLKLCLAGLYPGYPRASKLILMRFMNPIWNSGTYGQIANLTKMGTVSFVMPSDEVFFSVLLGITFQ